MKASISIVSPASLFKVTGGSILNRDDENCLGRPTGVSASFSSNNISSAVSKSKISPSVSVPDSSKTKPSLVSVSTKITPPVFVLSMGKPTVTSSNLILSLSLLSINNPSSSGIANVTAADESSSSVVPPLKLLREVVPAFS